MSTGIIGPGGKEIGPEEGEVFGPEPEKEVRSISFDSEINRANSFDSAIDQSPSFDSEVDRAIDLSS